MRLAAQRVLGEAWLGVGDRVAPHDGRGVERGDAEILEVEQEDELLANEQVCELAQALERRGPLRPRRVGRDRGRERGAVVGDVDGGVGEEVERACGLARLLAAERREVELRLRERLADAASDGRDALVLLRELLDGSEEVLVTR